MIRLSLILFFLVFLCFFWASSSWAQQESLSQSEKNDFLTFGQATLSQEDELPAREQETSAEKEEFLSPGQKTRLLNAGSMVSIFVYGLLKWDYGESSFRFQNEGWFGVC